MPLVSEREILDDALKRGYAVGAFNANGAEYVSETIAAAELERSPVIIQISPGAIKYVGLEMAADIARGAGTRASVPVSLHLDHGQDFAINEQCAKAGFTGLMYDGSEIILQEWTKAHPDERVTFETLIECVQSSISLRRNIAQTKAVVYMAKGYRNLPVEAEIGHIPKREQLFSIEDQARLREMAPADALIFIRDSVGKWVEALMADPDQVETFVQSTGCYSLAAAIGSIHGMYNDIWPLRIDRLSEIHNRIPGVPLVSHGSSGILRTWEDAKRWSLELLPDEGPLEEAVKLGLAKVNVATALTKAFRLGIDQSLKDNPGEIDTRKIFAPGRTNMRELVAGYMRLLGSAGKA
jgi:fructose-bisphosphate aldolase class II